MVYFEKGQVLAQDGMPRSRADTWIQARAAPGPERASPRPVQKHKRTQDWRAGPFRSSSPRGEPQIWGVSEAMSAIRVLRTRTENNVQQGDATLSGWRPGSRPRAAPGPEHVLAGYATVAVASILDPSGGLFSDAARPGQCPFSYWAQTWHSKIAIRDESQK